MLRETWPPVDLRIDFVRAAAALSTGLRRRRSSGITTAPSRARGSGLWDNFKNNPGGAGGAKDSHSWPLRPLPLGIQLQLHQPNDVGMRNDLVNINRSDCVELQWGRVLKYITDLCTLNWSRQYGSDATTSGVGA